MADKKLTGEKCPAGGCRGYLQKQCWGEGWERMTCSNPQCSYTEVREVRR